MNRANFYILTGAPGSGKTTLLRYLRTQGIPHIAEPARPILSAQRSIDGNGLPEKDPHLFVELMLSRMLDDYVAAPPEQPVLFDRGLPDMLAYAAHFGFSLPPARKAAQVYRYHPTVFFAPAWKEIYTTDDERKMPFAATQAFDAALRTAYADCGYTLMELPYAPVEQRATFIIARLGASPSPLSRSE